MTAKTPKNLPPKAAETGPRRQTSRAATLTSIKRKRRAIIISSKRRVKTMARMALLMKKRIRIRR